METFKVLQARYSRVEFLFSSLLSFYHVRYQKVEMSPAGFNTKTLMTNNVSSMISCHCQNLVLMLQCYSLQGKGWQNRKVLSELFLDLAETLQTQLQKRQLLHTKHYTTNMVISRRRFLMKFDVSDVSVVDYQSLRRSITEKII